MLRSSSKEKGIEALIKNFDELVQEGIDPNEIFESLSLHYRTTSTKFIWEKIKQDHKVRIDDFVEWHIKYGENWKSSKIYALLSKTAITAETNKLRRHLNSYAQFLEEIRENPKMQKISNTIIRSESRIDGLLTSEFKKSVKNQSAVKIQAWGFKLSSLLNILETRLTKLNLSVSIQILLLHPLSKSAEERFIFETLAKNKEQEISEIKRNISVNEFQEYQLNMTRRIEQWLEFSNKWNKTENIIAIIKLSQKRLSHYYLRSNDTILISDYLLQKGKLSSCQIFNSRSAKSQFESYSLFLDSEMKLNDGKVILKREELEKIKKQIKLL